MYVRIQRHWDEVPHDEDGLYRLAIRVTTEILEEERRRLRADEQLVALDDEVPEDAMDQAEDMVGEEIGEFYQPDEDLHVEDLIADTEIPGPEEATQAEAVDACYELLGALPSLWRRALTLVHREGLALEVVAGQILDIGEEELRQVLALGERFLRDHLVERGLGDPDVPALLAR